MAVVPLQEFLDQIRQALEQARDLGTIEYADLVRAFDDLESRLTETEAGLLHAEKSALLGQLATGIAHEFGTPLNVISEAPVRLLPAISASTVVP